MDYEDLAEKFWSAFYDSMMERNVVDRTWDELDDDEKQSIAEALEKTLSQDISK